MPGLGSEPRRHAEGMDALADRDRVDVERVDAPAFLGHDRVRADLDRERAAQERHLVVAANDGRAAHRELVAVARDDVADHDIEVRARHAVPGENLFRRECTRRDVQDALRGRQRPFVGIGHGGKRRGAIQDLAIHLEGGIGGRLDGEAPELRIRMIEGAEIDDIAAGRFVDRDQRAAHPELEEVHRLDGREQEGLADGRRRRRRDVDFVRGGEVEVELEQGRRARHDDNLVGIVELELEIHDFERVAVFIDDDRLDRQAGGLDAHVRFAVVEAENRTHIGALRDRLGSQELGEIHELCKVHALGDGERFHLGAVLELELERHDVDRVGKEVPVRVGQADDDLAASR